MLGTSTQARDGIRSCLRRGRFCGRASKISSEDPPHRPRFTRRLEAELRYKTDEEDRRASRAARRAVRVLRTGKLKMSARDAARLLGLSHQRVHQLTQNEVEER